MGAKLSGPGSKAGTIQQNSEINVTPFVDIMLVLLMFRPTGLVGKKGYE